ncbi:MAG: phosphoribosylanthranilate isomerase [Gemmatimonadetes bacterium]|nr:phosphoribosylanthranilate isomerase [Gemmatimonadota bacterium]
MADPPEFKVCGLTRPADAALAVSLGARYVGTIHVGGPRLVTPQRAREVYAAASGAEAVAVVPIGEAAQIAALGAASGASILQVHADPTPAVLTALRAHWPGAIWAVVRLGHADRQTELLALAEVADALVADTATEGGLGGTGRQFDWTRHATALSAVRRHARIVLAGGLHSGNISDAVRALAPDVVDVSSGVEDAPGVKSPDRMRAFARAVALSLPSSR